MRYCVDNIWGNMFDLNEWSLFRTCKQIHAESRPAFYQHCEFYFELFGPGCCKLALAWLESIGDVGRRNTRELTFDCYVSDTDTFLQDYVGPIHGKLTDAATVTYMGAPKAMWRFGRMFMGENAKVPLCEHCDNPGTTYDLAILEEPPEAFSEEDCDLAELKFCLGMLWFGPQAETPIACEGAAGEEGKADQT